MKEVVRLILIVFFSIFYRVELVGRENIPAKGAAVLCGNHVSELDMFFIGYRIKRLVRWMSKEELFHNPVLRFLLTWLGAFPVKRGRADVGAIKNALRLLKEGHIVGIFPEGTRTKQKEINEIRVKPGAVMLAMESGAPILPVAITASYKPFSRIRVIFGKPYLLEAEKDRKYSNDEMKEIGKAIMKNIYRLVEAK
jgi:1-acyl-sn-glycerol-3-phosphate acyltransferase